MESKKVRIALIGATGACGKEVVRHARKDPRVSELILVVRRSLDEWKTGEFTPKLTIVCKENFDDFEDIKDKLEGVDAFVCCLGTRVGTGEENFIRVDYQYPLNFATFAKQHGIPHYGLLTSTGSNENSCLLYPRTKGRAENDIRALQIPSYTIYQPGFILDREND